MNIETVIIWHDGKPTGLWFNDELIWETDEIIADTNLLETKVSLPLAEAVKFVSIVINGMTAERLLTLLAAIQIRIEELNESKTMNDKKITENDIYDSEW